MIVNAGQSALIEEKQALLELMDQLGETSTEAFCAQLEAQAIPNAPWHFAQPINDVAGAREASAAFFMPLKQAMPDLECRLDLLIGGDFDGRNWVGAMGRFTGNFEAPFLKIAPTHQIANLRFGSFHAVENGRFSESYMLFDLMAFTLEAGYWPWSPSLGREHVFFPPATQDGILLGEQDPTGGEVTVRLAEAMGAGLREYDGKTLASMGQERFWHPKMMWYGPAGIGSTRGLKGFQDLHQIPFLKAFPDRVGGNHQCRFGEGHYAGWVGWPSVKATHLGGDWLGLAPTGKPVTMRVMDFYRREDGLLRENWVFIDLLDIQIQLGLDPFRRIAIEQIRKRKSDT